MAEISSIAGTYTVKLVAIHAETGVLEPSPLWFTTVGTQYPVADTTPGVLYMEGEETTFVSDGTASYVSISSPWLTGAQTEWIVFPFIKEPGGAHFRNPLVDRLIAMAGAWFVFDITGAWTGPDVLSAMVNQCFPNGPGGVGPGGV